MSATAYGTRLLRRYDFRRFGFGLVRSGIYAGGLFALALILAFVARADILAFLPPYLGEGPFGAAFICTLLSLAACALRLIIDPRCLMLDTLRSNELNLYYKLGCRPLPLALVRPSVTLWGLLRVYLAAFGLSAAAGLALSRGASYAGVADVALALALGVCGIIVLAGPALFVGVAVCSRVVSSLAALVSAAAVCFLMNLKGVFAAADELSLIVALTDLLRPALLSLSLLAAVCLVLMCGSVAICAKNLRRYDEEALDDEALVSLGVSKEIAIYELNGKRLSAIVANGELIGRGERPPDLIVDDEGEVHPATFKTKQASSAKRSGGAKNKSKELKAARKKGSRKDADAEELDELDE